MEAAEPQSWELIIQIVEEKKGRIRFKKKKKTAVTIGSVRAINL